jgi:3-phosphoshikimate 1-carboxyvinyltransferase
MRRVLDPLRRMGAEFEERAGDGLPIVVRGRKLVHADHEMSVPSAQVKSALLLAALVSRSAVSVRERIQTRDHTERLLAALGVPVRTSDGVVSMEPVQAIPHFTFTVPGDPSSAAFLIAATVLTRGRPVMVEGVGINPTRSAFIDVLRNMGAQIDVRQVDAVLGEPVGDILVEPSPLSAVEVTADIVPWLIDEIPILAVLASRARGRTAFRGVGELRVKECDRLAALHENLRSIGGDAVVDGDDLLIRGRDTPYSGVVDTRLDHRIAMAFATLNASERVDLELSEHRSPRISYPDFFSDLQRVVGRG